MDEGTAVERALIGAAADLAAAGKRFALVGGLAVSVRSEVRFTRDVDLAVSVVDDVEAEGLVYTLRNHGYTAVATVEHETRHRLSTVRLMSPPGVKVDLLFASSGLEAEVVERATGVRLGAAGNVAVAQAEELLALKVLSMTEQRLQDRSDAQQLLLHNPNLDIERVRQNLRLISERGFDRGQNLQEKLASLRA
jgi:hypothetical protein